MFLRWILVVVVVGESAGLLCVMGETRQRMFVLVSPVSCGRFGGMFEGGWEGEEREGGHDKKENGDLIIIYDEKVRERRRVRFCMVVVVAP